jgi:hypothetical protein
MYRSMSYGKISRKAVCGMQLFVGCLGSLGQLTKLCYHVARGMPLQEGGCHGRSHPKTTAPHPALAVLG